VLPDRKIIVLVAQRDAQTEDPAPQDLYDVATAAMVLKAIQGMRTPFIISGTLFRTGTSATVRMFCGASFLNRKG
jgi:ATP-dependent Lon protease